MYLVNEVLKYLKAFLLGTFSTALLNAHTWTPPPSERIMRQVARSASHDMSGTSDILQP